MKKLGLLDTSLQAGLCYGPSKVSQPKDFVLFGHHRVVASLTHLKAPE